jgi:ribose transport system substrate-binding protein
MKKRTLSYLLIMIFGIALLLAACNGGNQGAVPDQNSGNGANPEPAEKKQSIGMLVKDATAEYIQAFMVGAQDYCDENNIDLKIIDGGYDTLKFLDGINQYIMQGIDGFIIAAVEDPVAVIPGIESLNEKGIPVIALDTCPTGGTIDMFITFDLVDSTRRAAEQMIEGIKAAHGGEVPAGVIIEITGALVDMFAQECMAGLKQVIDQYPQLTIVQGEGKWFNEDAFSRTADLLTRHGDEVVGIYCQTPDIMGSGTVAAVESLGRDPKNYFISGICIGSEGIELLKSGKLYAVVEQPALSSAIFAVQYLDDLYHGRSIPQIGETLEEEGALWSPAQVVENEYADEGVTMILQGPLVPQEVSPDDARLWENILFGK